MKESTKKGLDRYVENRGPVGDFLRAVLENNLVLSFGYADDDNRRDLQEIVRYVYNEFPADCWGSCEKVNNWLNQPQKQKEAK
uniref:Uncharacterized protein n=1 Tax=viral metagenome TaxID=1070528 RepID=A0A6H1ZC41_9ZZZZ